MAMNVIDVEYEEIDLGQVDGTNGTNGRELELQVASNYIQMRYTGGTWANLLPLSLITGPQGLKGDAGKKLQLQANGTYIQYKYEGETAWVNLIALSVLKGPKGEEMCIRDRPEDSTIKKVMMYRSIRITSSMSPEQRRYYAEMKRCV